MPVEGKRFQNVDATWRALIRGAVASPKALVAMRQPGQLAALTSANELLEEIQKGLNAYLESKRLIFPRFFFLSNDELLEILAETKDPTRVQPHLRKVRAPRPAAFNHSLGPQFSPPPSPHRT